MDVWFYFRKNLGPQKVFDILSGLWTCRRNCTFAFANKPALGASGAIMGLFAAFAYLFPNTQLIIFPFPVPVKAKWAVALMAAIDLFGGVYPTAGGNIAHFAHLGGLLMGFILVIIWNKTNRKTFY